MLPLPRFILRHAYNALVGALYGVCSIDARAIVKANPRPGGAPTSALQHVGIRVDDLDRAISFYQEVLDAKLAVSPIAMGPPGAAAFMNGPPDTSFGLAMLTIDGGVILELFQFVGESVPEWVSRDDGLLPHAGFVVSNVSEVLQRAEAAGARRRWPEPVTIGGAEMIYLSDPFGNTLELMDVPGTSLIGLLLDLYPEGAPRA